MTIEMAEMILTCLGGYLGIGLVVGIGVAIFGLARLDHAADGGTAAFRVIVLPGLIALWPAVLVRLFSMRKINAPIDGHDDEAGGGQ